MQKPNMQKKSTEGYIVGNRAKEEDDPAFCVPFRKLSQLPTKSRQTVNGPQKINSRFPSNAAEAWSSDYRVMIHALDFPHGAEHES